MGLEEVRIFTHQVDGWLADKEGELLYRLAKSVKGKGAIVEIGSWKGKSTIWLCHGSKHGKKVRVHAIDPHTGAPEHQKMFGQVWTFDEFKNNIKKAQVEKMVVPLVKTSKAAARSFKDKVELIFIDGAHEYEAVKLDFETWFPKVVEGGVMAFHDTMGWAGPKKVVADMVYKSKHFKNVRFAGSITYAQKVAHNTFVDRLRNRQMLIWKDISEFVEIGLIKRGRRLFKAIRKPKSSNQRGAFK